MLVKRNLVTGHVHNVTAAMLVVKQAQVLLTQHGNILST
jgi:hypothetical protein